MGATLVRYDLMTSDRKAAMAFHGVGEITMGPHQVPSGAWIVRRLASQGALFAPSSEEA